MLSGRGYLPNQSGVYLSLSITESYLTLIQLVEVTANAVPLIHPITAAAILISLQRLWCCSERNETRKCLCTGQRSQDTGVKLGAAPESIWRRDKCSDFVRCETIHKTTQPLMAAVPHRYRPPVRNRIITVVQRAYATGTISRSQMYTAVFEPPSTCGDSDSIIND